MRGITSDNRVIVDQGPYGGLDILAIPTGAGTPVALAADASVSENFRAICPDDRVVYGKPTGATSYGLFSVRPDGSGTATLANSAVLTFLGVTTTGRVVYGTGSFPLYTLHSVNSDGTDERTLNVSANGMKYLGLSSSGKVLYLDYTSGGLESDLYIVGHDGGAPINLTGNPSISSTVFLTSVP